MPLNGTKFGFIRKIAYIGENVNAYYLNITNPAPENVGYKALNKFKGQNNAGVKAREYLESLGYDGVNNENEEYISFHPEQAKLTKNTNPTGNEDIRYSLPGAKEASEREEELIRQNEALERQNERLKAKLKWTGDYKVSRKETKEVAKKLIQSPTSKASSPVLTVALLSPCFTPRIVSRASTEKTTA